LRRNDIRLFVIVPAYGNWGDTLDCLRALDAQDCRSFRVLVADDESPEPAPAEVHSFALAEYHRGPHLGFAGNCNRASWIALQQGGTHLLFLNNDTSFSSGFIGAWLKTIAAAPEVIISPLIFWFDKPDRVWISGGKKTIFLPYFRPAREYFSATPVEIVCGCALLVPSTAWRRLRGFDERFITYYEDYDFTLRAQEIGIPTSIVPDIDLRVWHKVSGSFRGKNVWQQQYQMLRSRLLFIRTHYRGIRKAMCVAIQGAHLVAQLVLNLPQVPSVTMLRKSIAEGLRRT
jgi:GT2 family glycosyltransferase